MNLNKLAYVKQVKYLGVIVYLKDNEDILRHLHNFYARSISIIRTIHHCSIGVKLHICFMHIVHFIVPNCIVHR